MLCWCCRHTECCWCITSARMVLACTSCSCWSLVLFFLFAVVVTNFEGQTPSTSHQCTFPKTPGPMTISSTIGIVKPYKDGVVPFKCHWTNSSLKQNSMQKQLPPDITVNVDGYPRTKRQVASQNCFKPNFIHLITRFSS